MWVGWPVVNGRVDGEDDVEEKGRQDEEVEGRIETGVVLVGLRCRHGFPFDDERWNWLVSRG